MSARHGLSSRESDSLIFVLQMKVRSYLPLPEEKKDRRSFLGEKRKGGFVHTGRTRDP